MPMSLNLRLPVDTNNHAVCVLSLDSAADQVLDFADESVCSEIIDESGDRIVMLSCDAPCHIVCGNEPELCAQSMNAIIPANTLLWIVVPAGSRIAALQSGESDGQLSISPCA